MKQRKLLKKQDAEHRFDVYVVCPKLKGNKIHESICAEYSHFKYAMHECCFGCKLWKKDENRIVTNRIICPVVPKIRQPIGKGEER